MTVDLEARLRRDLPRLAEVLTDAGGDGAATGDRSADADSYVTDRERRHSRRPLWLAVAACLLVVVGILAVMARNGDDRATTSVTADPAAPLDTWANLAPMPLSPREDSTSVWTGSEWLVFGGRQGLMAMNDSAAYDPATDTWRMLAVNPTMHPGAQAVWTGHVAVVLAKGGGWIYDPAADSWTDLPRQSYAGDETIVSGSGVWTGDEVVTVGVVTDGVTGTDGAAALGARSLDPTTMTWGPVVRTDALAPSIDQMAMVVGTRWDGSRVQVWLATGQGWAYDPLGGTWEALAPLPVPLVYGISSVSIGGSGERTYALAYVEGGTAEAQLAIFEDDAWRMVGGFLPWPTGDLSSVLVAAGDELIVLSSQRTPQTIDLQTGATRVFGSPLIAAGLGRTVAWTGDELLVAGGRDVVPQGPAPDGTLTAAAARLYASGH